MALTVLFELTEAPKSTHTRRDEILQRLAAIDAATTKPRTTRELSLGNVETVAWVAGFDAEAQALRVELAEIRNSGGTV